MHDTENINVKINIPGKENVVFKRPVYHEDMINWVKSQQYDDVLTEELVKLVSKYPINSFEHFKKNIQKHILSIRKKLNK